MRFDPRLHRIVAVVVEGENAGHHFHLDLPELERAANLADDARAAALAAIYDVLQTKGTDMTPDEFKALDEQTRLTVLANGLSALRTAMPEGPNLTPIEKALHDLQAAVATLADDLKNSSARVSAIEMAILTAGGK